MKSVFHGIRLAKTGDNREYQQLVGIYCFDVVFLFSFLGYNQLGPTPLELKLVSSCCCSRQYLDYECLYSDYYLVLNYQRETRAIQKAFDPDSCYFIIFSSLLSSIQLLDLSIADLLWYFCSTSYSHQLHQTDSVCYR